MKYIYGLTFLFLFISITASVPLSHSDIVGTVYDEKTQENLAEAEVHLIETGQQQLTDENGEFRFTGLPSGTYTVKVSLKDYNSTSVNVEARISHVLKIPLKKTIQLATVDVKASLLGKSPRRTDGGTLRAIPGNAGDAFRALTFHPSIGTVNDFMSILSVRGGAPGDNVYYFDRLPLAFPYHLLGIVSTVSADTIQRVDVYPGGFGANFGSDAQAVIDIHSYPQGDAPLGYLDGKMKANYIYSEAFLSGRIGTRHEKIKENGAGTDNEFLKNQVPGHGYWYAFGRHSYLEPFFKLASKLVNIEDLVQEVPRFWSYQLKGIYKLNNTHGLAINTVTAYDSSEFKLGTRVVHESDLRGPVDSDNPFDAQGIHLYSQLSPKLSSILSFTRSFSENELAFGEGYFYRSAASNYMLRSDVTYEASDYPDVEFGLLLSKSPTTVISDGARQPEEGDADYNFRIRSDGKIVSVTESKSLHRFEGYAQTELRTAGFLVGTLGMRFTYFSLIDSLSFQPRGNLSMALNSEQSAALHFSFGRYVQAPRLEQVVLGARNPLLTPIQATHYVVELEQGLNSQTKVYIAGYYKDFQGLIRYNDIEKQYQNTQVGFAQGVEISLQHKISKEFEGWLAYAYTVSKRQDFPEEPYRDYSYNKPHSVTVAGSYSRESWRIGAKWQYMSGVLYAPLEGRERYTNPYTKKTIWQPFYGESKRTSPYHRLDISLRASMDIRGWKLAGIFEVWNVYNRANVLQVRYDSGFTKEEPNFQLPIVPFIGVILEF